MAAAGRAGGVGDSGWVAGLWLSGAQLGNPDVGTLRRDAHSRALAWLGWLFLAGLVFFTR
jgi:hypothetical protein